MSTLFETYYDSFGHELQLGSPVFIKTGGHLIFGSVVKFLKNKSGEIRYSVVPSAKYKACGINDLRRSYNVSDRNIFLATIKKKN